MSYINPPQNFKWNLDNQYKAICADKKFRNQHFKPFNRFERNITPKKKKLNRFERTKYQAFLNKNCFLNKILIL